MEQSILISIKNMLGIDQGDPSFDKDLIPIINSHLMTFNQLGLGPVAGFYVNGIEETWTDFIGTRTDLQAVSLLMYLKVRLVFDPPQSSFLVDAIKNQITELEWRLNIQSEGGTTDG